MRVFFITSLLYICIVLSLLCPNTLPIVSALPSSAAAASSASSLTPSSSSPSSSLSPASSSLSTISLLSKRTSKKRGKPGRYTFYHTTRQLYDSISSLSSTCGHLKLQWHHDGTRSLLSVLIDYQPQTYTKTENALLFFGEHARELISPEVALRLLAKVCDSSLLTGDDTALLRVLRTTRILLFPNANPAGRRLVEQGSYCRRTNANNVDINRNWAEHFSTRHESRDTFPGKKPFSEPETAILARAAVQFKPTIFISIHSGSLHMLSPLAYNARYPSEPGHSRAPLPPRVSSDALVVAQPDVHAGQGITPVLRMLRHTNNKYCQCVVGAAGKELGYISPGTCIDYIYNKLGVRYSFALEIYDGNMKKGKGYKGSFKPKQPSLVEVAAHAGSELQVDAEEDALMLTELSQVRSEFFTHDMPPSSTFSVEPALLQADDNTLKTNDAAIPDSTRHHLFPKPANRRAYKCFRMFNPLSENKYERTVEHWSSALFALVDNIQKDKAQAAQQTTDGKVEAIVQADAASE